MDTFFGALDNLMNSGVYLTIGVISLIVLIIGFIADGIFEALDFGDGPLSITTLGAFGSMLGFIGFAVSSWGGSNEMALLIGSVVGILAAVGAWWLSSIFKRTSSSASISNSTLEGKKATVTLRIPGGDNPGEIAYYSGGMRHSYTAYSKKKINSGETVKILSVRSENSVNVELFTEEDMTPVEDPAS